jgi:hypothetical protein
MEDLREMESQWINRFPMTNAHHKACVLDQGRGSDMLEDWHQESDIWDPDIQPHLIKNDS